MKFKNKKELITFVIMNLLGAPITPIIFGLKWGFGGFIISIMLFLISFKAWKYFGKKDAKLSIKPSLNFVLKKMKL